MPSDSFCPSHYSYQPKKAKAIVYFLQGTCPCNVRSGVAHSEESDIHPLLYACMHICHKCS